MPVAQHGQLTRTTLRGRSARTAPLGRPAASPEKATEAAIAEARELASLEEAFLEAHRLRRLAEQEGGEAPSAEEKQRMLREARRLLQGLLGKLLDNDDDNDD